jgi:LysM repeat protein
MNQSKRLFFYLMLNVVVSACTVLVVLFIWERRFAPVAPVILPTEGPSAQARVGSLSGTPGIGTPQPIAQGTQTPTPGEDLLKNVEEYQVQFGDTLGLIAEKYDVQIEDLLRVNQINDPNSLSVGMVIYVPLPPDKIPTDTPTLTTTPNLALTVTLSGSLPEAKVVINSVIGAGDLASERVFLTRTGFGELDLTGWQLRDQNGNVFTFPQLVLFESGAVNVWTTTGTPTVVDLYWGLGSAVWSSGETVVLVDNQGKERAKYAVP